MNKSQLQHINKPIQFIIIFCLFCWFNTSISRTVVLGFDGMDPQILSEWMSQGHLPNFETLKNQGFYAPLQTTNPAQSPVAWSTFATGLNPGEHGIFDFIHRNPNTLEADYSISGIKSVKPFHLFDMELPFEQAVIYNKRIGKPFWLSAEHMGHDSTVLRVPATYPPDDISTMLSGMGVPDILGSQGTFSYFSTKYINPNSSGGQITRVKIQNNEIKTELMGPTSPIGSSLLTLPMTITKHSEKSVTIELSGNQIVLNEKEWSDWQQIGFKYAGLFSIKGMVRIYLEESFPRFKMYVSPINVDPQNPIVPISSPPEFAANLSDDIGLYHTLGMPEETWSLNDGLIDDDTYLDMVKTILAEREAMFFHELNQKDKELIVGVFVQTDRVSHMFWRGYDENHPAHGDSSETAKNAMLWVYQEADRILGNTLNLLDDGDRLVVLSDHGFTPYYYHVNLNKWLSDNNYLVLKKNTTNESFEVVDIDWTRTKAYAMGLNGIYANLKGRESQGWLNQTQADKVLKEISQGLKSTVDPATNEIFVRNTYNREQTYHGQRSENSPDLILGYERGYRASWQTVLGGSDHEFITINTDKWSGDHCIDPILVPGIIMTNFQPNSELTHIKHIASEVLAGLDNTQINEQSSISFGIFDFLYTVITYINQVLVKFLPISIVMFIGGMILIGWQHFIAQLTSGLKRHGMTVKSVRWLFLVMSFLVVLRTYHYQAKLLHNNDSNQLTIEAKSDVDTTLPKLKWLPPTGINNSTSSPHEISHNQWQIQRYHTSSSWSLVEKDGISLLDLNDETFPMNKVKHNWTHLFISNPGGYLNSSSQVDKIIITATENNHWVSLFGFISGFILALFISWKVRRKHHRHEK